MFDPPQHRWEASKTLTPGQLSNRISRRRTCGINQKKKILKEVGNNIILLMLCHNSNGYAYATFSQIQLFSLSILVG